MAQQAAARQGTHATKTRGEVRGGGRKPYKQKGTGRARQGSTRAPQFAGGGVVHGPQPRDYDQRTPKKMKAAALRGALSDRARAGRIHVVESLIGDQKKPSTKGAVEALNGLTEHRRQLVVLERDDAADLALAAQRGLGAPARRRPAQHLRRAALRRRGVHQGRLRRVRQRHRLGDGRKATIVEARRQRRRRRRAVEAEAVETEDTETEEFAGSAAPLESGEAPEGYEIKGNKDSMKYHAPGGQWYDATEAEVWFKTAADAEAAGFVEAGSQESVEQTHAEEDDQ